MAIGSVAGMFSAAGGGSFVGGAAVRLALDSAQFQSGLKSSEAQLHAFGRRVSQVGSGMQRVGGALTRNLTVPIIAAGAASVKVAVDFEQAFTRIRSNTNLTTDEIDTLRKHVLELAGRTAKSPQELAEGLYFLASAGLSAAQVQETLTMSAKASAAGFGEVGEIARLTANALNAYAKDGLTAAQVTDTLAAAIRVGTAEPDEFSTALGRILPAAQKAGVGFDEVTASLASLSNIGLDVNEGVTAMRGFLLALISPGTQAQETMKEFGLSADSLRASLSEDGLLATLRLLEDRTNGNMDAQRKIIPNIRALSGLFGITGQKASDVNKAFQQVTGATGDLDKAFEKTKQGPAFQFQQLMAELHTLGIEIGTEILPVVIDVAHAVRDMVRAFKGLPEGLQDGIVKWGLYAAALGPVLSMLGRITSLAGRAGTVLAKIPAGGAGGAAAGATKAPVAGIALLAAANVLATHKLDEQLKEIQVQAGAADSSVTSFGRRMTLMATGPVGAATSGVKDFNEALGEGKGVLGAALDAVNPFNDAIKVTKSRVEEVRDELLKQAKALDETTEQQVKNLLAVGDENGALRLLTRNLRTTRAGINDAAGATADHTQKVHALSSAVNSLPNQKAIHFSAPGLTALLAGLRSVSSAISSIGNVVANVPHGGQRAMGGAVRPQHVYTVGERGPETLIMGARGGYVVPHGSGSSSLRTNIFNIDARNSTLSAREFRRIAEEVVERSANQDDALTRTRQPL